jgi:hypothetical protein
MKNPDVEASYDNPGLPENTAPSSDLLAAALAYAKQGQPVFACEPGGKRPHSRLAPNGFKNATTDPDTIREWFDLEPTANIGMPTGLPTTYTVLDVDIKPEENIQGDTTLDGLVALNGDLPITRLQRTPSGGMHFCFASVSGLGNSAGSLGKGLDIRGEGGYIVVAPSVLPTGVYTWVNDAELAPIPEWITAKLTTAKKTKYKVPADAGPGNRNDTLWKLGRSLRATGNDELSIGAALIARNQGFSPPLSDAEVDSIIARVISTADRPDFTPPPPSAGPESRTSPSGPTDKPTIYTSGDLTAMTEESWAAITAANTGPSLFQRSTEGTRLERDDDGFLMTKALTENRLRRELARVATFKARTDDGGLKDVHPPMSVVQNMLADPQLPLPVLDRIVEVPTFASTGRLRTEPGYDPDGRTFYMPPADLVVPPVPEQPTADEIQAAVELIREVFQEFAVVGEADTAHAIGLMLQPFMRDLIRGPVPNHIFDAPAPGTGKTLMARAALLPALGRQVVAMGNCRDEEEWRKRVGAKLMAAAPVVFMDNIKTGTPFDSAALASAITSYPKWEDRRLGVSEMPQMPVRAPWVTTGNNITLSMELARRSIRTRLVAPEDRPWLRTGWKHDPLEDWILVERPRLIHACLTLGQAWIAAGRPAPPGKVLGMFESWVRVIGGILMVAKVPGFLENIEDLYAEADLESGEQREFFTEWRKKFNVPVTVVELVTLETGLPNCVLEAPDRRAKLGYYLRGLKDKKVRLEKNGPTYTAASRRNRLNLTEWFLREGSS